jgi:hypothetical protein
MAYGVAANALNLLPLSVWRTMAGLDWLDPVANDPNGHCVRGVIATAGEQSGRKNQRVRPQVYRLRNFHTEKVKAFQAPNGVLKHDVNERCHWLRDPIKCVVEDDGDGQAGPKRKRPSKCHRRYPKSEAICRTTGASAAAILSPPSTERCTRST